MTDFSKYITTDVIKISKKGFPMVSTRQLTSFGGGDFSIDCDIITHPRQELPAPHRHTFPQYLCFLSSTPDDEKDFDAEVEIGLGDDHEIQVIKQPTIIHVPAGMYHGPLNFAKINKPVLFIDIGLTGQYTRIDDEKK
jgi:hypothetical protein